VNLLVAGEDQADDQAIMREFGRNLRNGLCGFFRERFPVLRFGPGDSMSISRVSIEEALRRKKVKCEGYAPLIVEVVSHP
jgi:hypothetical protein